MRIVRGRGFGSYFKNFTQPLIDKFDQTKRTFNALAFGISDYNAAVRSV